MNNYAFIDSQNLNLGIKAQNWTLDFLRFRKYLTYKYNISEAFIFIGFSVNNQSLYNFLQRAGYTLVFKQTI